MEYKQELHIEEKEILSPLQLYIEIQHLKWEVGRLISNAESERGEGGTISRASKRLKEDIEKLDEDFKVMMYDRDQGFVVKVDRLTIKSERHEKILIGVTVGVIVGLAIIIVNWILKK